MQQSAQLVHCSIQRAYNTAYLCVIGASYISRTDRCLEDRIRQQIPRWVERSISQAICITLSDVWSPALWIVWQLLETGDGIDVNSAFGIIFQNRRERNLITIEAVSISLIKPEICAEEKLFAALRLPWDHTSWSVSNCYCVSHLFLPWIFHMFIVLGLQLMRQEGMISSCNIHLLICLFEFVLGTECSTSKIVFCWFNSILWFFTNTSM